MFRKASGRLSLVVLLFAIAGVLQPWCSAQEADTQVQEHFLAAQRDQQQGLLDDAVNEYRTVLRLRPQLPEAYVNLGLVYFAQAKFEDSARAFLSADKMRPGMRGVSLWLGIDEVKLDHPTRGVALLREAIRTDPNEKLAQSWLGTALWNAGQVDAALIQLKKAASQFPDDPDLLFALGEGYGKAANEETQRLLEETAGTALSDRIYGGIYAGEHDWTKAKGHLTRAIERAPHSIEARLELAEVLLDQGQLPDARKELVQAVALAPKSAASLARSGELLLLMQQQKEGLARIEASLNIDPSEALDALGLPVEARFDGSDDTDPESELSHHCRQAAMSLESAGMVSPATEIARAALYALAGDEEAAIRAYKLAGPLNSTTTSQSSPYASALTDVHQHHYDDAQTALLRWLAIHPDDRNAEYELVLVRRHLFIAQVTRLMAVAPNSYHVHQLLGQLYADREEDDKALAEYREVEAADPNLPDVHFWLGHLYWKHGDADHAAEEFTQELKLDPGHAEANGELGAVLVAEDRASEAIPHLEAAIHSKPDLWPAYEQLGKAYAMEKKYARAEEMLRHALSHDPDGSTHFEFGLVLRAEGKTSEAAQAFATVRAIKNEKMTLLSSDDASEPGTKQ